jgi:tellurite resistance protein
MSLQSHGSAAAGGASDADLTLLRLLCCIAWSDGQVAPRERQLLEILTRSVLLPEREPSAAADILETLVAEALKPEALAGLIEGLQGHDQRQLALKLAYMVIRISQEPGDNSSINLQEKQAYRRLVDGLGLPESEVLEAQWAAEEDLREHNSLWALLASRFSGLGAWPSDALLAYPEIPGL